MTEKFHDSLHDKFEKVFSCEAYINKALNSSFVMVGF
jgi:hypothetical protein